MFLVLSFVSAWALIKRTRLPRVGIIVAVLLGNLVLGAFVWYPLTGILSIKVQGKIAQPYIQKALDVQCGAGKFTADMAGFYTQNEFIGGSQKSAGWSLNWRSGDGQVECIYYGHDDVWKCSCP